jgi:hypothetical protein
VVDRRAETDAVNAMASGLRAISNRIALSVSSPTNSAT